MPQADRNAAMIEVHIDVRIAKPPAAVFAFLTDAGNFKKWQEGSGGVEFLDRGPWRNGTRLKTIHSFLIWKHLEDWSEIIEIVPNRRIRNRGKVGKTIYREEFGLEMESGGT